MGWKWKQTQIVFMKSLSRGFFRVLNFKVTRSVKGSPTEKSLYILLERHFSSNKLFIHPFYHSSTSQLSLLGFVFSPAFSCCSCSCSSKFSSGSWTVTPLLGDIWPWNLPDRIRNAVFSWMISREFHGDFWCGFSSSWQW